MKKLLLITLLVGLSFTGFAQLSKTFDTLNVKTLRALRSGAKNDSTLNIIYDDYANSRSIITVNDTTLRAWVGNISGGGGSSDSSWTSIQVDTIQSFLTGIVIQNNLGSVRIEDVAIIDNTIQSAGTNADLNLNANGSGEIIFNDDFWPVSTGLYDIGVNGRRLAELWTNTIYLGTGTTNEATFTNSLTADRTYTFQDASGTVAFLSDISGGTPAGVSGQLQYNNAGSFGAVPWSLSGNDLVPDVSASYDLGQPSARVQALYVNALEIYSSIRNPTGTNVNISDNFLPTINDTYQLGTSSFNFSDAFITTITGDTYTPVLSDSTNVDGTQITAINGMYQRVKNIVSVDVVILFNSVPATGNFTFRLSLPIASTLSTSRDLIGGGVHDSVGASDNASVKVIGNSGTNNAAVSSEWDFTGTQSVSVHFTYEIL